MKTTEKIYRCPQCEKNPEAYDENGNRYEDNIIVESSRAMQQSSVHCHDCGFGITAPIPEDDLIELWNTASKAIISPPYKYREMVDEIAELKAELEAIKQDGLTAAYQTGLHDAEAKHMEEIAALEAKLKNLKLEAEEDEKDYDELEARLEALAIENMNSKTKLKLVGELPEKWRIVGAKDNPENSDVAQDCADELEAILKVEGS